MSQAGSRILVVVSYYDRRTDSHLKRLLDRMQELDAGAAHDTLVVVNSTGEKRIDELVQGRAQVLYRENTGMNIGAWNAGWQLDLSYDRYVFLQDECFPVRNDWLRVLTAPLDDIAVGLVGESFNPAWDAPWDVLARAHAGSSLPDHFVEGRVAERVATYLHAFRNWGIDAGPGGRHLRSLVWALRRDVLQRTGGFPSGSNYGECIAAEIGVSRKIEAAGLRLEQAGPKPFYAVMHFEWNSDAPHVPPTHKPRNALPAPAFNRAEMDREAVRAWERAVNLVEGETHDAHAMTILALKLKLADRALEIERLRNALLKTKRQ